MNTPDLPPSIQVFQMILGRWVSQSITAVAKLGIADQLATGPKSVPDLARAAGAHAPSLQRVLRLLASVGIFAEQEGGQFANTPTSDALRASVPGSARPLALLVNHPALVQTWLRLDDALKVDSCAFVTTHGENFWDFVAKNSEFAAVYSDAMTALTAQVAPAVAATYDFSGIDTLVDIAGTQGLLLTTIVAKNPKLRGILFELPAVAAQAKPFVEQSGVRERCEVVGGDFFSSVPSADGYIIKHTLHDWSDRDAIEILKVVHRNAKPNAKLLVVESVMRPGNEPDLGKMIDVEMLLITAGGRERSEPEFAELFAKSGFQLERVIPTPSPVCIVEAKRI